MPLLPRPSNERLPTHFVHPHAPLRARKARVLVAPRGSAARVGRVAGVPQIARLVSMNKGLRFPKPEAFDAASILLVKRVSVDLEVLDHAVHEVGLAVLGVGQEAD